MLAFFSALEWICLLASSDDFVFQVFIVMAHCQEKFEKLQTFPKKCSPVALHFAIPNTQWSWSKTLAQGRNIIDSKVPTGKGKNGQFPGGLPTFTPL